MKQIRRSEDRKGRVGGGAGVGGGCDGQSGRAAKGVKSGVLFRNGRSVPGGGGLELVGRAGGELRDGRRAPGLELAGNERARTGRGDGLARRIGVSESCSSGEAEWPVEVNHRGRTADRIVNRWVFITAGPNRREKPDTPEYPRNLLLARIKRELWPLRRATQHRRLLGKGDEVLLYLARSECAFVGTAKIAGQSVEVPVWKRHIFIEYDRYRAEFGVALEKVEIWEEPIPVKPLVGSLDVFVKKDHWGGYFQMGVIRLSVEDYRRILSVRAARR